MPLHDARLKDCRVLGDEKACRRCVHILTSVEGVLALCIYCVTVPGTLYTHFGMIPARALPQRARETICLPVPFICLQLALAGLLLTHMMAQNPIRAMLGP